MNLEKVSDIHTTSSTPTPNNEVALHNVVDGCRKLQRMISISIYAKYVLFIALLCCTFVFGVSGILLAVSETPTNIVGASHVFYSSAAMLVLLCLGIIFSPTPNNYGTALVARASMLHSNDTTIATLKAKLSSAGENAINWKLF